VRWQRREPKYSSHSKGAVTVLEAEPGQPRDAVKDRWLSESRGAGAQAWLLRCAPESGGIWAGLGDLMEHLVPRIRETAPDLVFAHSNELCLVVPGLRSELAVTKSLTDAADDEEKTRNYAADRAYRSLHGLIELLAEWHERGGRARQWAIVCDDFDLANGLVRRFFRELVRRRGSELGLSLLVTVAPGSGEAAAAGFPPAALAAGVRLDLPVRPAAVAGVDRMTALAADLERHVEHDSIAREVALPRLISYWQQSRFPERALRWQVAAMHQFNHDGLYEASLPYAAAVEANLDRLFAEDQAEYLLAVNGLYFCWVPLDRAEAANRVLDEAIGRIDDPAELPRLYYLQAMLHTRFLAPIDLANAEGLLDQALSIVAHAGFSDHERQFWTVFLMNGLALVRVRQRRAVEAVELCRAGAERLNEHLDPSRHRLHRSVLLYNIAQVYAQIGPVDKAIEYFGQTMAMDPNYSEYYNERGAVFFKLDRLEEAEADYRRAIELSPPYPEVWTNLGQCYRAMGRMADAAGAYSRSLDLDPSSTLALAGRAEAYSALDRPRLALADCDRALALDPDQPLVLASRAILHYEAGRVLEALADLDSAVALAPEEGDLYQNRAVALRDLGRVEEAARDLDVYLRLNPDAEDRAEIEKSLEYLLANR
jgi:tetratricopeptide (TPR) repeat protein